MGVSGDLLSRVLKTASRDIDLRHYSRGIEDYSTNEIRPLRIGVDVSGWIARATHGHGSMLVDERHLTNFGRAQMLKNNPDASEFTRVQSKHKYVKVCSKYVLDRILTLQKITNAEILIVFDGKSPPLKQDENVRRYAKKQAAVEERDVQGGNNANRLKAAKRTGAGASYAIIIEELMILLRIQEIEFLVSPYEADGQLAFLSESGMVDLVLTEDSDLIALGVRSILYKEDGGQGKLVQRRDLGAMELVPKSLSLMDFSDCMIAVLFACVGCDYCDSLRNIGSVTAKEIVEYSFHLSKHDSRPPLVKVFELLYRRSNQVLNEQERDIFETRFLAALLMLRHPVIFDPLKAKCVLLRNPPFGSDVELMEYEPYRLLCHNRQKQQEILGEFFPSQLQAMIAQGYVDPRTMRPYPSMGIPPATMLAWEAYSSKHRALQRCREISPQAFNESSTPAPQGNDVCQQVEQATDEDDSMDDDHPETQAEDVSGIQSTQDIDTEASPNQTDEFVPGTQCDNYTEHHETQPEDHEVASESVSDSIDPTIQLSRQSTSTKDNRGGTINETGSSPMTNRPPPLWESPLRLSKDLTDMGSIDLNNSSNNVLTGSSSDNPATQGSQRSEESQMSADGTSPPLLQNPTAGCDV